MRTSLTSCLSTLAADDRALVERDPALPGLPVVLSDAVLSDLLGEDVRVTRLRYKPGRSVVAAWSSADATRHGWVGTHRDPAKLGKAVAAAERAGTWALHLGADRHVVATDVLGDRATSRALHSVRSRFPELLDDPDRPPELLRHNPSRRQVWRSGDDVLRVGTEPVAPRHALLATLDAHDVPVLRARDVPGVPTAELVPWWGRGDLTSTASPASSAAAGRAVALLHAVPLPTGGSGRSRPEAWASGVVDVQPAWRQRVLALRERLEAARRAAPPRRPVRLHGDLSPDQVLVDGDQVALIDLDRAGTGVPEQDLGSFLAVAHLEGRHDLVAPFLEGYTDAGGTYDHTTLVTWQAIGLVQRAVEPFRRREPDWARRAGEVLTDADRVLP